jgi:uncharacterized protein (TIGR03437 family)
MKSLIVGVSVLCALLCSSISAQSINTIAGNGVDGYNGDDRPAVEAQLDEPRSVAMDKAGNLYIADFYNDRIRRVDPEGVITTYAGSGQHGFYGDGLPATRGQFRYPRSVAVDSLGNLFIADMYNHRVRKVDSAGTMTTVAGNGLEESDGDGGPATEASVLFPVCVALDKDDNLYIAEHDGHRVRKVGGDGVITTVAGNGVKGFLGDGGPAVNASLSEPNVLLVAGDGVMYIADTANHRIRMVDESGVITTIAGTGVQGARGDGGPATEAELNHPRGLALGDDGILYIADCLNHTIRKIAGDGVISTVAGNRREGFSDDGGPPPAASLAEPRGMMMDPLGRIIFSDTDNHRVRLVDLGPPPLDPRPVITGVSNGASFQPGLASATWVTITGEKLSEVSRIWTGADFDGNNLPTTLDDVSVKINGKPAFPYYISPTQLNVLADDDAQTGEVSVEVTTANGISEKFLATKHRLQPAFFNFSGTSIVIGVATDGGLLGPADLIPGANLRPVRRGEVFMAFGTGFGVTDPVTPTAQIVAVPAQLAKEVKFFIDDKPARLVYAGMVGSGQCQFNIEVPDGISGAVTLRAEIDGVLSPDGVMLEVEP